MSRWTDLIIAELNSGRFFRERGRRIPVGTVGLTRDPVLTMGGLQLIPALTIDEVPAEETTVVLLPGGTGWLEPAQGWTLDKLREWLDQGVLVAAVCGTTEAMANVGMLDHRRYTNNSLDYLKLMFPDTYRGESHFIDEPAVTDAGQ